MAARVAGRAPLRTLATAVANVEAAATPAVANPRGIEATVKYGAGGRSSVSGVTATVFGSTGFLGRYVVNRLGKVGSLVVVPYRGDEHDWRHLKLMGDLGQINGTYYNPRSGKDTFRTLEHSNVVVNLVGRDYETSNFSYHDVHVKIPAITAKAAKEAGVTRFIHVSALGASEHAKSSFLQSKWEGEQAVRQILPQATIVRPSQMFGHEDRYVHRMAWLHFHPLIYGDPVVRDGETQLMPVYVADVADGIVRVMKDSETAGKTFEFVGPETLTYNDLLTKFSEVAKRPINALEYPLFAFKTLVSSLAKLPPSPRMVAEDIHRVTTGLPGLPDLGVSPATFGSHALAQLRRYRSAAYYDQPADMAKPINTGDA